MICTDNATTFTSWEFQAFLRDNGVTHRTIEPKHSRGNGLAERAVKEVKLAVQRGAEDGVVADVALQRWLFQQRTIQHSTTSVSPAELMIGRRPKNRLDLLHPNLAKEILSKQVKQKSYADRSARAREFHVGDPVFARNYAKGKTWLPGTVLGVDGPVSFVVRLSDGRVWRRHCEQLRSRSLDPSSDYFDVPGDAVPAAAEEAPDVAAEDLASRSVPSPPSAAGPLLDPAPQPVPVALPAAATARPDVGETAAAPDFASDSAGGAVARRPGGERGDATEAAESPALSGPSLSGDGAARGRVEAGTGPGERERVASHSGGTPLRRSTRSRRKPDFFQSEHF